MRIACLSALAAAVFAPVTLAGAVRGPSLSVTTASFTVRGVGFVGRERVTLTAVADGRHVRTITTTARGTFVVRFRSVTVARCDGYVVRAQGSRGSRATLKNVRECAPLQPADR
jgi:hypothetical protein